MTSNSFFERELRKALQLELASRRIEAIGSSTPYFARLEKCYPAKGSRIDWSKVNRAVGQIEPNAELQQAAFTAFFDVTVEQFSLSGTVLYLGDSATDSAFAAELTAMRQVLPKLLEIPQHHYFVAQSCEWCIFFSMEGDMAFGFGHIQ
ncbi:conserved hypothetical protein [Burkholderiales bacterium 8X]|nr:conserved hypothetical protein [Burkholderiales bacterium 8X]